MLTERNVGAFVFTLLTVTFIVVCLIAVALARDNGQWGDTDPGTSKWVRSLMQPDNPYVSCCGDADAYWADSFRVDHGQTIVTITDERPDEPLGRLHRPSGTEVVVPDSKMKWDAGNPSGHGWLFLSSDGNVFCYVTPGGV